MNRHCHRIIFNTRRGQLMAVSETAQGMGKSASGEGQPSPRGPGRCRRTMVAVWLAVGSLPMGWTQIVADPTAPANQRPTVLSDTQGRPLVNIQTPSAAGLSRNTYRQFDVPTSGIVLNNSTSNPWLANGVAARTILNEVNSTSQSYLNGAITVNGTPAQVIVANPNGITINGGSFINTTRATLTTGTAQVSNGTLTGFNVRGGAVTIGAGGLNNSATPYTDILSRAAYVSGALRAQNLGITTGLQTVAYDTGLITDQDTNTYAAGALTIDTAALGGMYANHISMLATEAGLAVRNQGNWQASGGQIVVTADGLLQNLGTVSAGVASLATVKGHIENAGTVQGTQAVVLSAGGDARLFGAGLKQNSGSTVIVSAKGSVDLYNAAGYGAAQVSSAGPGGQVSISAGKDVNLNAGTMVAAHGQVQVSSDARLTATGASVTSTTGGVVALAGTGMSLSNSSVTGQQVHLETGAPFMDTAATLVIQGGSVRGQTQTTLLATDAIQISSPGSTAVSGGGNVHIQATKALEVAAGSAISAGQHMSVMAGTDLNLQAASGNTATNGQKVSLTAGGNLLASGNSVNATGSVMTAGQDLSIEANNGAASLHALANAGGTSVDAIKLSAGKDLNVSAFNGALYATGLQASGQNINLVSNGTTSLANATVRSGANTQAVASVLTAREDITVASINSTPGASSQVQVIASNLTAGGQARVLSNGVAYVTAATNIVNGVNSPARSTITGGSVAVQGTLVQTEGADVRANGDKSSVAKSGDITVTATSSDANFNIHTGVRSQFNSTGHIALHANGNLNLDQTQINAGASHSSTSATGQVNSFNAHVVAKDVLSLASKGAQTHTSGFFSGGAASVYNQTGHLALNSTRVQALGTTTAGLGAVSGQTSIESGGTLGLDAASVLYAASDLSFVQGSGDITLNPANASRGTFALNQIGAERNLTLATRNGNINFTGSAGTNGPGSSSYVGLGVNGALTLVGNNVRLNGSYLQAWGGLNITATAGNLQADALRADKYEAGFTNTYWDPVLLQGGNISLRAAGDIALTSTNIQTANQVNIESGGNTVIAANYGRWRVDNRANGGWYQDEHYLVRSNIRGDGGVNIGALGGSLILNATDITAYAGTARLQALGNVTLEAAQEHKHHQAQTTQVKTSWLGFKTKVYTTSYDNQYLLADPVTVDARDLEIKAGNSVNTFATKLTARQNLSLFAGDRINYYAVYDQVDTNATTYKTSSFVGIKYNSSTSTNSRSVLTGQPTQLQSQQDILSQSGGNQLLQGTRVSYGRSATFQAGVGEKARADARIILEGLRNSTTQTRTKEANYVVWQKQINQGSLVETLTLPSFSGPTKPVFNAPGGLSVQLPQASDFKGQISTLASQPGMGYLNDLAQRRDVNWQPVALAFEQWNYKQEGLTAAGAALLAVAVAWAMPAGAGANLVGAKAGTTTALMADAAFSSLAAQAAITFVNNKGDIGKTLKELGSSQTVKATIAAALTAGVVAKLGATATMKDLAGKTGFSEKLTYNLINATGRALTNTAITGGNLEAALKAALIGGVVDTAHGQAASAIKGLEADYLAHKLAHALAGCIAGAAAQGTCRDGAIGAALGEIVAQLMPPKNGIAYSDSEKNNVLALSKLVAGATSAYAGGNAQTAITTAEVAVQNNALVPALIGLAWLADKAWTAYEVSQDVAAIRDGTKTVDQVVLEKGEEYFAAIVLGNIGRYGVKAVKVGGKWVQSKDPFSNVMESRGGYTPNAGATSNMGAFLKSPGFGSQLGEASQKTSKRIGKDTVLVANRDINEHIRKGDQFYLDSTHGNHIEVFDSNNKARAVLNLDGSLNSAKTAAALRQGRTIPK